MMTATDLSTNLNKLANSDIVSAKRTIDKEIETLRVMENELDISLTKALDMMQSASGRIILTGMGKSGHIAKKIAELSSRQFRNFLCLLPCTAYHNWTVGRFSSSAGWPCQKVMIKTGLMASWLASRAIMPVTPW